MTTKGGWLRDAGYRTGEGNDIGRGAILITLDMVWQPSSRRIRHDPRKRPGKKIGRRFYRETKYLVALPNGLV